MDVFISALTSLNNFVWDPVMLVLLVGTGLYLNVILRFFSFRNWIHAYKLLWQGREHQSQKGEISPWNALMTALAGDIGTGNIVGVATAIAIGGPGALFWMWVTALVGMMTKFSEIILAVKYREKTPAGRWVGGAMYFIKNGLGPKWKWLGTCFAIFGFIACFGIGNLVQVNAIAVSMDKSFSVPTWVTGLVLLLFLALILLGGVKRIGAVAGRLVPLMAVVYIAFALIVIIMNITEVPRVFWWVISEAFTPTSAQGGFAGATVLLTIRMGVARGIFSNEAGLGSAPIAAAAAKTNEPVRQGLVTMTGTFIDTIIICTMTGLSIVISGGWQPDLGLEGASITMYAFENCLPFPAAVGGFILMMALVFFAFTTILGWNYYAERCMEYLSNGSNLAVKIYRWIYIAAVFVGPYLTVSAVWTIADIFNGLMAIPNIVALLALSGVIARTTREYFDRQKKKA